MSDLDDLDAELAAETPRELSIPTMVKLIPRAVRSAYQQPAEDRRARFELHIGGLLPSDPATTTLDGWSRLGAHRGCMDAWTAAAARMPRDAPTDAHGAAYGFSWTVANSLVHGAIGAVTRG